MKLGTPSAVDESGVTLTSPASDKKPASKISAEIIDRAGILAIFQKGGDFNFSLRKAFPMTHEEIRGSSMGHLLAHHTSDSIHAALAREKLREIGMFEEARIAFITADRDDCLKKAQELIETGYWQNMSDAAGYLLLHDGHGSGLRGFENKCSALFDFNHPGDQEAERQAYQSYRELFFEPLRDKLDKMFQPLHAVTSLVHLEECIAAGVAGVKDSGPYTALRVFTANLEKARGLHTVTKPEKRTDVPETYFSDAISSDAGKKLNKKPNNPNITFSEGVTKARELAQILIKAEHRQLQFKTPGAKKAEFIVNVERALKDTGFTLENCGFSITDKKKGFLRKEVVGYNLVENPK